MGKDPAFPFYASDWLGSNARAPMSLAEQGAYINLLARQWSDKTCSLPDDDDVLAALSEMHEGWLVNGCPLVRVCFPPHPHLEGRIANVRLLELRGERDEWIEKSRKGGRKSAAARKLRQQADGKGGGKGGATTVGTKRQPKGNSPSSSSSPSSSKKKKPPTPFVRPSLEEVRAYCLERQNGIDPEEFIDAHNRNGWVVGKNRAPMKDWKATVRIWERMRKKQEGAHGSDNRHTQRFNGRIR